MKEEEEAHWSHNVIVRLVMEHLQQLKRIHRTVTFFSHARAKTTVQGADLLLHDLEVLARTYGLPPFLRLEVYLFK